MNITLSVALVTRNRPESLARTLKSLFEQEVQPYEILISDDSDTESAIISNKQLARKYGCKYFTGPAKGLYANRNFIAKNCSGTHFRTMDDDHEFPQNHIAECMAAIISDREAIWTIGEYFPSDFHRPIPAPVPGQLHPRGYSYVPKDMTQYYGISCGASVYPNSVVKLNILNIEYYKFGITYLEYGARLFNRGYRIKHLNTTYVIHHYDEGNRSISSMEIVNGAKVFSMLMISFYHMKSLKNQVLTTTQIIVDVIKNVYSFRLVFKNILHFKHYISKY